MRPDGEVWAWIEKECRGTPGFKSRKEWMVEVERKIAQATQARRQSAIQH
jgi:hypothetical protein